MFVKRFRNNIDTLMISGNWENVACEKVSHDMTTIMRNTNLNDQRGGGLGKESQFSVIISASCSNTYRLLVSLGLCPSQSRFGRIQVQSLRLQNLALFLKWALIGDGRHLSISRTWTVFMSPSRNAFNGCRKLLAEDDKKSRSAWPNFCSVWPHLIRALPAMQKK